jgi:protein disulfide isomerase family A protein 3
LKISTHATVHRLCLCILGTNYWRNRILKIAKQYEGKYNFAISSKDDFQQELNEYGYDYVPTEKPLICAKDSKKQKFILKEEFSCVF